MSRPKVESASFAAATDSLASSNQPSWVNRWFRSRP
ncbi:Uncharacterised protein [Mycobacteroides abscessus subsp. abscessus]|nr:Uncharacterised protein [Mycobacteroides abscessus subsp. abscessus]